jgi:cytochrome c551/c552
MLRFVADVACMIVAAGANANAVEDLAKAKGCLKCHTVEEEKVGPACKGIAAKYTGESDAGATLVAKFRDGCHMKATALDSAIMLGRLSARHYTMVDIPVTSAR